MESESIKYQQIDDVHDKIDKFMVDVFEIMRETEAPGVDNPKVRLHTDDLINSYKAIRQCIDQYPVFNLSDEDLDMNLQSLLNECAQYNESIKNLDSQIKQVRTKIIERLNLVRSFSVKIFLHFNLHMLYAFVCRLFLMKNWA